MTAAAVDLAEFRDALDWVARAVPHRPTSPVLGGIRVQFVDAPDPGVILTAFDYDVSHTARVPGLLTAGEGSDDTEVLVSGHLARDLVGSVRGDNLAITSTETRGLVMTTGRTKMSLPGLPLADFPTVPAHPPVVGAVEARELERLCRTTWYAVSRDAVLPVLTGINLTADGHQLLAETTNRFMIARVAGTWEPKVGEPVTVLVPAHHLGVAAAGLTGRVEVGVDENTLRLATPDRTVTIRRIALDFPKLAGLFPPRDTWVTAAEVDTTDFVALLKRARLVLEANIAALLTIDNDAVRVKDGQGGATIDDQVDADLTGDPFEIAFNPVYLGDAVASMGSERVLLGFTGLTKPVCIYPVTDDTNPDDEPDIDALVMPRRK